MDQLDLTYTEGEREGEEKGGEKGGKEEGEDDNEWIPCILSDHSGIKVETNSRTDYRNYTNTWILNNKLLNILWVTEEIKEEIKFLETNENHSQSGKSLSILKGM